MRNFAFLHMAGIYLHIPFCKQACHYCDFHFSTLLKQKGGLVTAMVRELELRKDYLEKASIETIYFGGGTPSILNAEELGSLLEQCHRLFPIANSPEITLECNPDDLTAHKLAEFHELGVNRLSIGLQSFMEEELRWMNRAHTASESESCVKLAQDKGFSNITIDLIYGSKFQTRSIWEENLRKAIALEVQHISAYNLTVEAGTKLGHEVKLHREPGTDEEKSSEFFLLLQDTLEQHGFIAYEISNYGKEGFFSRHNSNYWKGVPYLGIGPSAHSFDGQSRQWNIANNSLYTKKINENSDYFERELLQPEDRYNEYILTCLRTIWGCDLKELYRKFGEPYAMHFLTQAAPYLERKLLLETNGVYTLSKEGKLLADRISAELFFLIFELIDLLIIEFLRTVAKSLG